MMDSFDVSNISFLDLSDVDDQERTRVLSSLHTDNSCVKLPWKVSSRKVIHRNDADVPVAGSMTQPQVINHKIPTVVQPTVFIPNQVAYNPYINQQPKHFTGPAPQIYPVPVTYAIAQPAGYVMYTPISSAYPPPFTINVPHTNVPTIVTLSPEPAIINSSIHTSPHVEINEICEEPVIELIMEAPQYPQQNSSLTNYDITPISQFIQTTTEVSTPEPVPGISESQCNGMVAPNEAAKETTHTPAPVNKSWASLFNSSKSADSTLNDTVAESDKSLNEAVKETNNNDDEDLCPIKHPRKAQFQFVDPNCYRMGEFLLNHNVDGRTISLKPRGLINRSNYCYINSILQALLACPPAYNLLVGLSQQNTSQENQKATPIIDGMCRFVKEFEHLPAGMRVHRRNDKNQKKEQAFTVDCDLPFEPSWIYKMLSGVRTDSFLVEGRQEDAEEFLGFLLNGLNDEMIEIMKLVKKDLTVNRFENKPDDEDDDKEWQVMGPKNKGGITRQMEFIKTPISDIFGGFLKSRIHRAGDQSSYNIQPFFTIQLNIEKVNTVREALEALVTKNQLEGVTSEKTKEEVEAWQQVTLEELPVILILHLKCFDFKLDGCTKIVKALEFPIDLKIDSKLLSSKTVTQKEKQYKLFAVVYHDGKEATKGHYVTDAFHVGYSSWLRYDDSSVKPVQEESVLKPQGTRVPYLLFYRRSDTYRSK